MTKSDSKTLAALAYCVQRDAKSLRTQLEWNEANEKDWNDLLHSFLQLKSTWEACQSKEDNTPMDAVCALRGDGDDD